MIIILFHLTKLNLSLLLLANGPENWFIDLFNAGAKNIHAGKQFFSAL